MVYLLINKKIFVFIKIGGIHIMSDNKNKFLGMAGATATALFSGFLFIMLKYFTQDRMIIKIAFKNMRDIPFSNIEKVYETYAVIFFILDILVLFFTIIVFIMLMKAYLNLKEKKEISFLIFSTLSMSFLLGIIYFFITVFVVSKEVWIENQDGIFFKTILFFVTGLMSSIPKTSDTMILVIILIYTIGIFKKIYGKESKFGIIYSAITLIITIIAVSVTLQILQIWQLGMKENIKINIWENLKLLKNGFIKEWIIYNFVQIVFISTVGLLLVKRISKLENEN